jgi:hypothetical protein
LKRQIKGSGPEIELQEVPMSSGTTAVAIVLAIIVVALVFVAAMTARRRGLQRRFGPEYDRVVAEQESRARAEAELTERQRRVRKLNIKPLSKEAASGYAARWQTTQEEFVDSPQTAVAGAYTLLTAVLTERGYPVEDDGQLTSDLSVDHARTVGSFRTAQEISTRAAAGDVPTEDLRQAFINYRRLFADLLDDPALAPARQATADDGASPSDRPLASVQAASPGAEADRQTPASQPPAPES